MKHLVLTTIAAVVLVGCAKAPDISIYNAAYDGNIEAVKQHLAAGEDVNEKNTNSWTLLHYAAYYGHKEIVELLIANDAAVNAKTEAGRLKGTTPLDRTAIQLAGVGHDLDKKETADLLRKNGGKTGEELKAEGK